MSFSDYDVGRSAYECGYCLGSDWNEDKTRGWLEAYSDEINELAGEE